VTKQFMLIVPGRGGRLPKTLDLKEAGFLVSSALDTDFEENAQKPGDTPGKTEHTQSRGEARKE